MERDDDDSRDMRLMESSTELPAVDDKALAMEEESGDSVIGRIMPQIVIGVAGIVGLLEESPPLEIKELDRSVQELEESLGSKLKTEDELEEQEEDDDSDDEYPDPETYYYDSDSESSEDETESEEDDEETVLTAADYSKEEFVELIDDYDNEITDEDLMEDMSMDYRYTQSQKYKLLPKIRKYLNCIDQDEGYECEYFPGVIWGVTSYIPKTYLIDRRHKYPEAYSHIMYLANLALKHYNSKQSTEFELLDIKQLNTAGSMTTSYKITFTASSSLGTHTFRGEVGYNPIEVKLQVGYCDIHPSSTLVPIPSPADKESIVAGVDKPDPVHLISNLNALDNDELWDKIKDHCLSTKKKDKLLRKVRNYFDYVVQSQGFNSGYYPGHMPGVTDLKPRDRIIYNINRYGECYEHVQVMSTLGLDLYLKDKTDEYRQRYEAISLKRVNVWKDKCSRLYIYYITFIANVAPTYDGDIMCKKRYEIFESKVYDTLGDIEVDFCRKV